jgi:hypothetical protein
MEASSEAGARPPAQARHADDDRGYHSGITLRVQRSLTQVLPTIQRAIVGVAIRSAFQLMSVLMLFLKMCTPFVGAWVFVFAPLLIGESLYVAFLAHLLRLR